MTPCGPRKFQVGRRGGVAPEFDSFKRAIVAGVRSPRARRAIADSGALALRSIVGWVSDRDDTLTLLMDGGKGLTLTASNNGVEWSISEQSASAPATPPAEDIEIDFVTRKHLWRRGATLASLVGRQVVRMQAPDSWVFLETDRQDIQFSALIEKGSGQPLLFFHIE